MSASFAPRGVSQLLSGGASLLIEKTLPTPRVGTVTIRMPNGRTVSKKGNASGPVATINIVSWRAIQRVMIDGEHGLADAYLAGEWQTPDLAAVLSLAMLHEDDFKRTGESAWLTRLLHRLHHRLKLNTAVGSRRNIAAHYDLGNEFFQAWLDTGMNYSSAIYRAEDSLELAQSRKLDRIIDFLELDGSENILEIGCGWGALAERIVRRGCSLTGITLSKEQRSFAVERLSILDSNGRSEIKLQDYRTIEGQFDRIVSIEMIEAVGERFWPVYFAKLRAALRDGGIGVLQAITIEDKRFPRYRTHPDFIQRHVFPGGMLPTKSLIVSHAKDVGLSLLGREDFGFSYARTLADWRKRFHAAWPRIEALGFDERFKRTWEYYLSYCETGFRANAVDVSLFKFGA